MIFRVVYVGGDGVYRHVQQYFSYIVEVSLIGGGNRSIRRKPQTCAIYWLTTLSHTDVSSTPRLSGFRTHNVSGECS
jgi:hypothetical protein